MTSPLDDVALVVRRPKAAQGDCEALYGQTEALIAATEVIHGTSNVFADLALPRFDRASGPAAPRPRPQSRARRAHADPGRSSEAPWCVAAEGVGPAELQACRGFGRTAYDLPDRARPGRANRDPPETPVTALRADHRGSGVAVAYPWLTPLVAGPRPGATTRRGGSNSRNSGSPLNSLRNKYLRRRQFRRMVGYFGLGAQT